MSAKWHVNPDTGKTGVCGVGGGENSRGCPFGDANHFESETDAREAFESSQSVRLFSVSRKRVPRTLNDMADYHSRSLSTAVAGKQRISGLDLERRKEYVEKVLEVLVKEGVSSEDRYSRVSRLSGQRVYSAERAKKHEEIVDEILTDAMSRGVKFDGEAIFSGGLGGAGKTTVLNGHVGVNGDDYVAVNPDDIKEKMAEKGWIPKVKGLTPMEASPLAHEEASHISGILLQRAANERMNIIVDITMANVDKVKTRVDLLRVKGYGQVNAIFVDIKPETSVKRSDERYAIGMSDYTISARGEGGRLVPAHVVNSNRTDDTRFNSRNAKNLVELKRMGLFNETPLVFNNDGAGPVEVPYNEFSHDFTSFLED